MPEYPHHGLPFTAFLILVAAQSVLFTWLYLRTDGSLTVAVVFHAALNLFALKRPPPSVRASGLPHRRSRLCAPTG
jgi:membrane protease YdiL (CAAX protease family)